MTLHIELNLKLSGLAKMLYLNCPGFLETSKFIKVWYVFSFRPLTSLTLDHVAIEASEMTSA